MPYPYNILSGQTSGVLLDQGGVNGNYLPNEYDKTLITCDNNKHVNLNIPETG